MTALSPEKKQTILEKVKKLMALSSSPNEHEAALAAARAHDLLLKYNLSMTDIKHSTSDVITESFGEYRHKLPVWMAGLFYAVCEAFYCRAFKNLKGQLTIIGVKSDVEVARFTFDYLCAAIKRLADGYLKNIYSGNKTGVRQSYSLGASTSITNSLKKISAENEKKAQDSGGAIVLVKQGREDLIKKYLESYRVKNMRAHKISVSSDMAYRHGLEDGKEIKIARGGLPE